MAEISFKVEATHLVIYVPNDIPDVDLREIYDEDYMERFGFYDAEIRESTLEMQKGGGLVDFIFGKESPNSGYKDLPLRLHPDTEEQEEAKEQMAEEQKEVDQWNLLKIEEKKEEPEKPDLYIKIPLKSCNEVRIYERGSKYFSIFKIDGLNVEDMRNIVDAVYLGEKILQEKGYMIKNRSMSDVVKIGKKVLYMTKEIGRGKVEKIKKRTEILGIGEEGLEGIRL
jgi:hypothetical protein